MTKDSFNTVDKISRLIIAGIILLLLMLPYMIPLNELPLPTCLFKSITNLSCPSCGISRAFFSTAHGSINTAIKLNYMGSIIYIGLLLFLLKYILELIRHRPVRIEIPKTGYRFIFILFFGGWFSFWLTRLVKELI